MPPNSVATPSDVHGHPGNQSVTEPSEICSPEKEPLGLTNEQYDNENGEPQRSLSAYESEIPADAKAVRFQDDEDGGMGVNGSGERSMSAMPRLLTKTEEEK